MTGRDDFTLACRRLLSGEQRGPLAGMARAALWSAQPLYAAAVALRNSYFTYVPGSVRKAGLPVISVGNLTVGGTGKTPLVAFLARWFEQQHVRVAIVSRGYAAASDGRNDEARELAAILPGAVLRQDPDRVAVARTIARDQLADVILLDDGFQHRRLHRDLDIVLVDALQPDGLGYLLPRGLLREPLRSIGRADVIALTRSDAISPSQRNQWRQRFRQWAPTACWVELVHRPISLVNAAGEEVALSTVAGQSVVAFCGIGNPEGFRHTLQGLGVEIVCFREFRDHSDFSDRELNAFERMIADRDDADAVLCTRKDLTKIPRTRFADRPLWALAIEMDVVVGREKFLQLLTELIPAHQLKTD
jgi:tetraacyldisaccharide 4'-kinase